MLNDISQSPMMKRKVIDSYESQNSAYEPQRIFVGVTGGSAAGKTTLCETIRREIQYDSDVDMAIISLDSFYKGIDKSSVDITQYNFDHPDALDWNLAYEIIQTLLQGKPAKVPYYCFVNHKRLDKYEIVMPCQVIVFEGILALYDERIRACMAYKIFIHCDDDIRLCRRILRDVGERGRTVESVLFQYNRFVKKAFDDFISPSMSLADIIIPGSRDNHISVSFIVNHLKNLAKQIGLLREKLTNHLYFGDLLYQIEGFMRPQQFSNADQYLHKESKPYKQLFFPTEETMKQEYLYLVQNLFAGKLSTEKQTYKVFKACHKLTFQLTDKAIQQDKIDFNKIQCISLNELQGENNTINFECINSESEYILISIPLLFKNGLDFLNVLQLALKKQKILTKIIIVNIFSDIKIVKQIVDHFKCVKFFINAFLVGRIEKILQILKLNENEEPNYLYQQDKFFLKTQKHMLKTKKNYNLQNKKQEEQVKI